MAPVVQKVQDDFGDMFDVLDLPKRGYLTMEEIQSFYKSLFYKPVHDMMVKSVLKFHGGCNDDSRCTKKCFEDVLSKLEEKRYSESSTYWDFIALDRDGTRLVNVKGCLLLARTTNSDFIMTVWHDWLNSRDEPNLPISWCEFQKYLYYSPGVADETPDLDTAFDNEIQSINEREADDLDKKYTEFKGILEDDDDYLTKLQQDREDYQDNIRYESNRLLNRWDIGGAEAVIYDDGSEIERPSVVSDFKNSISATDLFSALDVKYNMLREKILIEMAKSEADSENPGMVPSAEVLEKLLHSIRRSEKKSRKLKTLDEMLDMPGSSLQHRFTALGVMGETADAYIAKWKKAETRFKSLKDEGKTADEINRLYEREILNEMRGSTTNGELLIHLAKRQEEEKEYITKSLQYLSPVMASAERLAVYASLHRQCLRAEKHEYFEQAATSACLAERKQLSDFERYNPDRSRQEKIAELHLKTGSSKGLGQSVPEPAKPEVSHSKNLGMVDSWLEITRLLTQKHSAERKVMAHFLLSGKLNSDLETMKNEDQKNLQMRRHKLTKHHDNIREAISSKSNASEKVQHRTQHFDILSSASALYWENIRRSNANNVAAVILARLQVLQDIESENTFMKMKKMNPAEIYNLRKEIYRSIRDELFENISDLVLGAVKISTEEKELIDLILLKYNKLRTKLFEDFIKKKKIDSEEARKQLLEKLRIGEEKHRQAGNHDKLAKLSKDTFQIKYTLQEIMGPDASRYKQEADHYLEELKDSGRKRKLINEPPELGNIIDSSKARGNMISELHLRYEDEVDMILENLRDSPPAEKSFFLAAEIAWQQWEILKFNLDDEFVHAALAMGLTERTKIGQGKIKLRQDNIRYVRLAEERLMLSTSLSTRSLQSMPASSTPVQSSLRRVLLCHAGDWRKLYKLLTDESAEELREAAKSMSDDERISRLAEINAKRLTLDTKSSDWQDDILGLLEEAAAIKYVSRMQNIEQLGGKEAGIAITDSDVQVSIMADLQEEHDKDGFKWFQMALKDPEAAGGIKDLAMSESKSCLNIFNVLCKYEGQTDDDELLQALEDKYDSLRDKLLAEALMKQLGEKAWHDMTERERQERIFKLKMEERRLRKEGRSDELAKLFGDAFANDEKLRALMGMNKDEYDRKLKERLANRKRGEFDVISEEDEVGEESSGDPLIDLTSRYEDEKEALLRMLAGQGDRYMSERDRQMELARLRRELRKSEREERFGAAALVLGLAERNAEMEKRLASDKKRQEELAKQRIAILRAKKGKHFPMPPISESDEHILKNGSKTDMIDAVLSKLELLYEAERAWLVHILLSQNKLKPDQTGIKENNPVKLAGVKSSNEISERLHEIDVKLPNQVNINEYKMPLTEASFFREALFVHQLLDTEMNKEVLDTKTLALLQDIQDRKSRKLINEMADMSDEKLIEMQELNLRWTKQGISENIPVTFFSTSDQEDVFEKAVDGKFDAILAGLVEKALIEKKGEKKWNSMSQPERERLIAEMMQKIKKLISEGKTDEAAALLGDSTTQEAILAMFGLKTDEEETERLEKERLERRRQRMEDGMSEEEADQLMAEEQMRDEENLKKRRKNVLDLLKFDLDAQKDALMKQMADGDERLDEERRRQVELAKLRLQQRMMERENDLNAVAHVLALSKMATDQLEAEKQRQLELAKRRLEAYRNGRRAKEDKILLLKLPDGDDIDVLIDAIIREMESKHAQERNVLMQLITVDAASGTQVLEKATSMDSESIRIRLKDLREQRRQWRNDDPENLAKNTGEQMEILVEATALNLELLKKETETSVSEESAQEEILSRLQNQQMLESSHLINDLPGKNASTLRVIAQVQWRARSEKWFDNVAESLLQKNIVSSEESEVLEALDKKYDLMRDKLIAEALIRQMGDKNWNDLSELERQRKVTELRIKERKLRQEGKMDEAAKLISSLVKSDEDLARLLGESKLSQKEEVERKLEQRRKLKEERLATGLAVDDNTLDEEMEKIDEEEKKKRKNVLLLLEHNLDEEREAILASLRKQDEVIGSERRRQLELARLRREQKQIAREDKFNAAAIIFNQAKKSEQLLATSLAENRARQLALAKERLASRKQRKEERESARALFDVAAVSQKLKTLEVKEDLDDSVSAPERLVQEMDVKQLNERENLFLLLLSTEMDSEMRMQVSSLTKEQIKAEKDKIVKISQEWREKRFVDLLQGKEEEDADKKIKRRDSLARSIVEQNSNFKRYMILEMEGERGAKPDQNLDFAAVKNEMSVKWLSEVQTSQASSVEAVHTLIADKSDEVLDMITYGQRKSRIESWNDNLNKVVMGILPPGQMVEPVERQVSSLSTGSDERAIEITETQMKGLDEELEEQKKDLEKRKNIGDNIDLESEMARLQQQHEAKRQALSSDIQRQKQKIQDRLAARREQRDEMEYEAHAAAAMVFLAERRLKVQEENQLEQKSRQRSMMQERLDARKQKRKEIEASRQEAETNIDEPQKKPRMPAPMGLKRQKTFADIQITDEDKDKMLKEMKEISDKMSSTLAATREKQKEIVRSKIRAKSEKKRDKVEKIFATFEREKTIVLEKKNQEFQRQKTMLQDRMQNIRTGKTKTMKENSDRKVRDFDELVNPDDSQGMSTDEKMALAAENLQKKFLAEKEEMQTIPGETATSSQQDNEQMKDSQSDQDGINKDSPKSGQSPRPNRMTDQDKERKLKQRMSLRKKQKQEEENRPYENPTD